MIINISDLETYLGTTISDTTEDKYDMIISSVQSEAEKICYRNFDEQDYISELHDGDGTSELFLEQFPVRSVNEVKYGSIFGGSERSEIDSDDYLIDKDIGRLSFGFNSIENINQVFSVTYNAGWTSVNPSSSSNAPDDLKMILMQEVQIQYNNKNVNPGLKSKKLGDANLEYFSNSETGSVSSFAQKLSKYIRSDL